jgi:hypothetical protein
MVSSLIATLSSEREGAGLRGRRWSSVPEVTALKDAPDDAFEVKVGAVVAWSHRSGPVICAPSRREVMI